jgi:proteasome lid subunit RPN8/RPN11
MLEAMQAEAARCYPNEACGVVVQGDKRALVINCQNVAENPRIYFRIDPVEMATIARDYKVISIWHSHVDQAPTPSPADIACCEATALPWIIISVRKHRDTNEVTFDGPIVHEPSGFEMPYIGRPYVYGVLDCYSLCVDFYKREFKLDIDDHSDKRQPRFWQYGTDHFGQSFEETGFVQLFKREEPQRGDLFLMQIGARVPNHIAIYNDNNRILHHCHGRLSKEDIYGGFWDKHTTHHLRHQSLCKKNT